MKNLRPAITKFNRKRILVIGDLILDQHIQGTVTRISPEAPVPVVLQEGSPSFALGGAANVANNLRSLGARVAMIGRIGDDLEGRFMLEELKKNKIAIQGVIIDASVPTILKTRIMAQHQQVVRLDREQVGKDISSKFIKKIITFIQNHINDFDAIIISDYGKGLVTAALVEEVCAIAKSKHKILTVDPKVEHFAYYRGVTAITPNKTEAENAIRNIKITQTDHHTLRLNSDRLRTFADIEKAGAELLKYMQLECLLITIGDQGMCLFEKGKKPVHIPTKVQEVFDVTGAGDTVIAVFTLGLASGISKLKAADLANHAAGVVVGKMGTVTVSRKELVASL